MRTVRTIFAAAMVVAGAAPGWAQLPGTDIYLAPVEEVAGRVVIGAARNLTARPGYDNQPAFVAGGYILYTAGTDTAGTTDIFRYQVRGGERERVTDTPESEYSPVLTPDGEHVSCVRVERDGRQRLWRFRRDGTAPEVVAPGVDSVGYYAWRDRRTAVVFIVGAPHSLRIVDTVDETETLVALDVGRSIHRVPGSDSISFLQRVDAVWMVMRLDAVTGAVSPIGPALEDSQDCAWTPGGRLLMAREGCVYVLDDDGTWTPVVAFGDRRLQSITRLAVDPTGGRLALVASD